MKFLVALVTLLVSSSAQELQQFLTDDFIESINQKRSTWVAGRNFPEDTPIERLRRLSGTIPEPDHIKANREKKIHARGSVTIPEFFDAREEWPYCESIKKIRNQGQCGACWIFAAVGVMSDRLCIGTKGRVQFEFSPEDILECCSECGDCNGGYTPGALNYFTKGVVSGGDYSSNKGCKPYQISDTPWPTSRPQCSKSCTNTNYRVPYQTDKHYSVNSSYFVSKEIEQIQLEIMTNGPVTAFYTVYDDFYAYQTGVYQYTSGNGTGGHSVKILGWGVEDGTPYWLMANSWGEGWGGLNGFFKFLRGQNHLNIESSNYAALPRLW